VSDERQVGLTRGLPETVLPAPPEEWSSALADALVGPDREEAVARVAASHPRFLDAWASLAEHAATSVERYAYARVGYHRGLDALRAAGWKGSGYVRWQEPTNRGFLSSLAQLQRAAGELGEDDEEARCATFLRQLDPTWTP